ncbi:MAG TPA: hypothetical protein VJT77_04305 [Burkholderiales bacterium]|nr:hypothetical protein [Burkholderiales bacterium]
MSDELLLVGSIPLETAKDVFTSFGKPLGKHLGAVPDGEVGFRRHWISRVHFQVFAIHPDIRVLQRPRPDGGVERLNPHDVGDSWRFQVPEGVQAITFGEPGWRLGFARDAVNSYQIFASLKDKGVLPKHLRFQVSIPMVHSAAPPRIFADLASCEKVRDGYADALRAELHKILEHIPPRELAIQWDCATELQEAYKGAIDEQVPQVAISRDLPKAAKLGYHLCFGTLGGWPRFAPDDLGAAVKLANAFIAGSGRKVDWMHLPVLDRSDDAFFAPLKDLRAGNTRIYLGMVHNMERFKERLATARKYIKNFGVGAFCGFGRMPPSDMPRVLKEHKQAISQLQKTWSVPD